MPAPFLRLLAVLLLAGAGGRAVAADGAAFDAAFRELTGPAALQMTVGPRFDRALAQLRAQLPAGDAQRQLQFEALDCWRSDQSDPLAVLARADAVLARAEASGDVASAARARYCRAGVLQETATEPQVIAELDRAIALVETRNEAVLMTQLLMMRADSRSFVGEHAEAVRDYQRARTGLRLAGIEADPAPLLSGMSAAYRRLGDLARARTYITAALAIERASQDHEGEANDLIELGYVHEDGGDFDAARAAFQASLDLATTHQLEWTALYALLGLSEALVALDRGEDALATLDRAQRGFRAVGITALDDALLRVAGRAKASLGRHAEALADYRKAMPLLERNGNARYLAEVLKAEAASLEALGRTAEALAAYQRYGQLALELRSQQQREQNKLYEYEYEFQRSEHENRRLRAEAAAKQAELEALQQARRWQWIALALGGLLLAGLGALVWHQASRSRRHREESRVDPLTGVANRRGFAAQSNDGLAQAARSGMPLSLLVLDLDHFKSINDRYGHGFGDRVLREVSAAWTEQLREKDRIGRLGGEEFAILCPDTTLEQALVIGNRLRESVSALRFDDVDPAFRASVSIGITQQHAGDGHDDMVSRADAALYRAKRNGRNRVEV